MTGRKRSGTLPRDRGAFEALSELLPLSGFAIAVVWVVAHVSVDPSAFTEGSTWIGLVGIIWLAASAYAVVEHCSPVVEHCGASSGCSSPQLAYFGCVALATTPGVCCLLATPSPEGGSDGPTLAAAIGLFGLLFGVIGGSCHARDVRRARTKKIGAVHRG